jgi:hypothetical protein
MNKEEAAKIVAHFEETQHDEDAKGPNPAQLRIARKVLAGKIPEGQVFTEHPVTHEPCEPAEAARVLKCLAEKVEWKLPEEAKAPEAQ